MEPLLKVPTRSGGSGRGREARVEDPEGHWDLEFRSPPKQAMLVGPMFVQINCVAPILAARRAMPRIGIGLAAKLDAGETRLCSGELPADQHMGRSWKIFFVVT